jgi:hypothetical protein
MNTRSLLRALFLVALAVLIAAASPRFAGAQQVTYYDFDSVGPSNFSIACSAANNGPNILFCFNSASSPVTFYPSLLPNRPYPANVDPNPQDDPPAASQHTSLQLTDGGTGEYSSAWFAVPQKVSDGFSVYTAFRLTGSGGGDGFAFVIQNALSGGQDVNSENNGTCVASGAGLNARATIGACLGYGGIPNSVAVEFDTFQNVSGLLSNGNPSGPVDNFGDPSVDHIAIKSCGLNDGVGLPNSPNHSRCTVGPFASELPSGLLDGQVHEAVIEYTGATETPANSWKVYIDPAFVPGTHTPANNAHLIISQTASISGLMNLQSGGNAYVGFTGASGGATSNQEVLAWTYTPHSPVTTQPEPIGNGTPTTFPFGAHTYAVTYPAGTPDVPTTDMVVIATTVPQDPDFTAIVAGTPYAGSQCQVYEGTGNNCIIYSVYCVTHGTSNKVACPSTSDPVIAVKTAYESTGDAPTAPGFLHGDPFYSPISSIHWSGGIATVNCTGQCSVTDQQTVSVRGNPLTGLDAENVVATVPSGIVDSFTYPLAVAPATPDAATGYVTSNNFTDICNVAPFSGPEVLPGDPGYNPPCWQPAKIDGTTSGKTKNFSDLAALSTTVFITGTTTTVSADPITYPQTAAITVSVSPATGSTPVTGGVSLTVGGNPPVTQTLSGGSTTFSVAGLDANPSGYALVATYLPVVGFATSTGNGTLVVNKATPTFSFTGAPASAPFQSTFNVASSTTGNTPAVITPSGACSIAGTVVTMTSGSGTCTLTAIWAADTNYAGATLIQSTAATKLTPVITWTPAALQLGLPLTASQLNASTTVPGNFAYTPILGTAINTTTQTLSVMFTPTAGSNYNSVNKSVPLSVLAGPLAKVTPANIDFGTLYLGSIVTKTVTVSNIGNGPMTITGPFLAIVRGGNSNEFVSVSLCPKSLAAGKSCTMTVAFLAGPYYTAQTATLTVKDNAPGNPQIVPLTALVINPRATLSASSLSFGNQKAGTTSAAKTVTLKNTGATTLTISGITIIGSNPADFSPLTSTCGPSLTAGSSCTVSVQFHPSVKQSRSATLRITDNAQSSPQSVSLSGKGI